jgi:hypothetical protein
MRYIVIILFVWRGIMENDVTPISEKKTDVQEKKQNNVKMIINVIVGFAVTALTFWIVAFVLSLILILSLQNSRLHEIIDSIYCYNMVPMAVSVSLAVLVGNLVLDAMNKKTTSEKAMAMKVIGGIFIAIGVVGWIVVLSGSAGSSLGDFCCIVMGFWTLMLGVKKSRK